MKYTLDHIQKLHNSGKNLKYVFFWGHHPSKDGSISKSCLSQWYDCEFEADGIKYRTAEQYMMAQKALLFDDKKIFDEIMQASHPKQFKDLGRKVSHFDEKIWNYICCDIVIKGNFCKFSQNERLKEYLLSTKNRILVEASPYDNIWGIKMSADDERITDPYSWKGTNFLGFCLMEVRDMLSEQQE